MIFLPGVQEELTIAYERLQSDTASKLSKMRRKCEGLNNSLREQTEQCAALRADLAAQSSGLRSLEGLQAKVARIEGERREERTDMHRALDKHKKEVRACMPRVIRGSTTAAPLAFHLP